ncbi:uroporphyrinogen-III C-methyltransferase [Alsobacter soli]|uniref:Uroporphyrinogen-III C-methyltransferase n=1 Tax=Alsobacter soli TaxID=2109933 RepID=A0A2T1HRC3_9HYPH|nr:siroheme synthase CysG [Alsobacter soli]PSC04214.1 uroporphyrinogen-III C-methyltransferase [Alsobacter soli]
MTARPRRPTLTSPARIGPLAALPLFHKLEGRRIVLAGGGDGAAWKAELLAAAGAHVEVHADVIGDAMQDVADRDHPGKVELSGRPWSPEDLRGAALAIADVEGDAEAEAFRRAAQAARVPVNIVDKPAFCDFQFGSIVNRSPLVIGISTDGAAPVFGQAIRARIEALLPNGLKAWAEAAKAWRPFVQERELPFRMRRGFWERFTDRALAKPDAVPTDADRDDLLAALERIEQEGQSPVGSAVFVGAGPGDPELLTLKAVRALQSADVVLFDDLVDPRILDLARREAERIGVGKRGHRPSCKQDEITDLIVRLGLAGKRVVRLKGGDPAVFGRLTEELEACHAAGVPTEVVPGITAAFGAAAAMGVSLTERSAARRLQFVTAHSQDGSLPQDLDWKALADPRAATVVYMGVRTAPALVERLLAEGLPPSFPALLVERATTEQQAVRACSIADLPAAIATDPPSGPCLIILGAPAAQYVALASAG